MSTPGILLFYISTLIIITSQNQIFSTERKWNIRRRLHEQIVIFCSVVVFCQSIIYNDYLEVYIKELNTLKREYVVKKINY